MTVATRSQFTAESENFSMRTIEEMVRELPKGTPHYCIKVTGTTVGALHFYYATPFECDLPYRSVAEGIIRYLPQFHPANITGSMRAMIVAKQEWLQATREGQQIPKNQRSKKAAAKLNLKEKNAVYESKSQMLESAREAFKRNVLNYHFFLNASLCETRRFKNIIPDVERISEEKRYEKMISLVDQVATLLKVQINEVVVELSSVDVDERTNEALVVSFLADREARMLNEENALELFMGDLKDVRGSLKEEKDAASQENREMSKRSKTTARYAGNQRIIEGFGAKNGGLLKISQTFDTTMAEMRKHRMTGF